MRTVRPPGRTYPAPRARSPPFQRPGELARRMHIRERLAESKPERRFR
ncbi:MAG: hypothetical protein MZV64_14460 [Ignavibacteriales bacterium]|nr:hypothetical protein [Ignavibacteriales bacterium]